MSEIDNWYYLDPDTKEYYVKNQYIETSSENLILVDGLYLVTQDITIDSFAKSYEREKYVEEYNEMESILEHIFDIYREYFKKGYTDAYKNIKKRSMQELGCGVSEYAYYISGYNMYDKDKIGYTDCIIHENMDNIPELEVYTFTSITFPGLKIDESCSIEFPEKDVMITKDFTLEKDANIKCKKLSF